MVQRRTNVSDSNAFSFINSESSSAALSFNDITKQSGLKLFPNPATDSIEINNLSNYRSTLQLKNILGATIRNMSLETSKQIIDISDFKAMYIYLQLIDTNVNINQRFVKL